MSSQPPLNMLTYSTQPPGARLGFEVHPTGVRFFQGPASLPYAMFTGLVGVAVMVLVGGLALHHRGDSTGSGFSTLLVVTAGLLVALLLGFVRQILCWRVPTVLGTDGDRLVMVRPGWLRPQRRQWTREQVKDIRVIGRGIHLPLRHVGLLRVFIRGRRHVDLFEGFDHAELRWVEQTLRQALRLPQSRHGLLRKMADTIWI